MLCRLEATRFASSIALAFLLAGTLLAESIDDTARAIRQEATRGNSDPSGRPLPLAAHWNTGALPGGFSPAYQLDKIAAGAHVLPGFTMPWTLNAATPEALSYYEASIKRAAALKLPIAFLAGNYASSLYDPNLPYFGLPPERNPNVIQADGTIRKQLDPMGPVGPWAQLGAWLVASPVLKQIQKWYPDPPLVVFVSNNEESRLAWNEIDQSKRFRAAYGVGRSALFKRTIVARGWIERYRALEKNMRDALDEPGWREHAIFVAYDAFGPPHYARWDEWDEYGNPTGDYISPAPLMWDGGSPSFYLHNWNASTDYKVWSPQGEALNWVFMLKEALRLNPRFWFELSTWDGEEEKRRQLSSVGPFTPARYAAMVEFGMWLLRPRSVREFRGWNDTTDKAGPWFDAVLDAVDRVYRDATLERFWRRGELAPNRAWPHPYQSRPLRRYASEDRWFALDTSADPQHPFNVSTGLPVWSLALTLGRAPHREWLLYAHAPMGDRHQVEILIPGYRKVTVDVPVAGAFYLVRENQAQVERVGQ